MAGSGNRHNVQGVEKGLQWLRSGQRRPILRAMEPGESEKEVIQRALAHLLSSAGFSRNQRQSKFLRYLVDCHLEGRAGDLKESVIAVEVFDRRPDYDPKLDA